MFKGCSNTAMIPITTRVTNVKRKDSGKTHLFIKGAIDLNMQSLRTWEREG